MVMTFSSNFGWGSVEFRCLELMLLVLMMMSGVWTGSMCNVELSKTPFMRKIRNRFTYQLYVQSVHLYLAQTDKSIPTHAKGKAISLTHVSSAIYSDVYLWSTLWPCLLQSHRRQVLLRELKVALFAKKIFEDRTGYDGRNRCTKVKWHDKGHWKLSTYV